MTTQLASVKLRQTKFVNDAIAKRFTPKRYRNELQTLGLGHIFATIPGLVFFAPLIVPYLRTGNILRGLLVAILIELAMVGALGFVSWGKQEAIKVVSILEEFLEQKDIDEIAKSIEKIIAPSKQTGFGIAFGIIIVVLAQLYDTELWIRASISIAVFYAAFLVGTAGYLVLCVPVVVKPLSAAKYKLPTLFPYQTIGLRRIGDIGVSFSLSGAILAAAISACVLGLELSFNTPLAPYWNALRIGVVMLSWLAVSVPFASTQILATRIIRHAKDASLSRLSQSVEKALEQVDGANRESIERLQQIQGIYDQVYKSRESILNLGIFGKFLSSLLLVSIPSIISMYVQSFLK
jgi:hypothetical protein